MQKISGFPWKDLQVKTLHYVGNSFTVMSTTGSSKESSITISEKSCTRNLVELIESNFLVSFKKKLFPDKSKSSYMMVKKREFQLQQEKKNVPNSCQVPLEG